MASFTRVGPQRRNHLLLAALLSIQATIVSCFQATIPSRHRHHHEPTSTSLHETSNNQLPFFAAPSSFTSSPATSTSTPQSSTVTLRLPLGTLFDGRDYIFVTYTNVRGYEWSTKEVNVLVEDLMDASLGSLGGELRGDAAPRPSQQQSLTNDFELSQICLVPTSDWDANTLGLGNRYDVYDGQQRLVTLNLLLAALRDSFQKEARENAGGKRGVALEATANEISGMLKPSRVRKEDVLRITLRKRDNVLLEKILSPKDNDSDGDTENEENDSVNGEAAVNASKEDQPVMIDLGKYTPTEYLSKLTPKEKNEMLASLSSANARIVENFLHIADRLSLLSTRERLRLLDYIVERVHLLVCIPETSRIARNIVMSQGRKGMDNEAIDDFKGLVCFRYTLEEKDMYQTFDRWDTLAAEPTVEINGDSAPSSAGESSSSESIMPVGRDTIAAACLLRASASLRTKIRSGGGDEVYEWERWLRHVLWVQNQKLTEGQGDTGTQQSWQGKDFMTKEIEPASIALYKFRNGQWDDFNFMSKKMTKEKKNTIISQLTFLRDIIAAAASAKEAEILVLDLLLRTQTHAEAGDNKMLSRDLDEFLPLIERWSLWMALTRPSPMQRHARVFELLDTMEGNDSSVAIDAATNDFASLKEAMNEYKFGASASGKRLAAAVLGRMNSHLIIKDGSNVASDLEKTADLILPEKMTKGSDWEKTWSEEQHEEWGHSLGNLALMSKKGGKRKKGVDATTWEEISKAFKKESWPMTRTLAESDSWDVEAVKESQQLALSMIEQIWMK